MLTKLRHVGSQEEGLIRGVFDMNTLPSVLIGDK